jgi:hypothetical protein
MFKSYGNKAAGLADVRVLTASFFALGGVLHDAMV